MCSFIVDVRHAKTGDVTETNQHTTILTIARSQLEEFFEETALALIQQNSRNT